MMVKHNYYFMAKVTKRNTDNKNCRKKNNGKLLRNLSFLSLLGTVL